MIFIKWIIVFFLKNVLYLKKKAEYDKKSDG